MEWKPVVGYERAYSVSDQGDIYSYLSARLLKPVVNDRGYLVVQLRGHQRPLHQIVLEAFVGPRPEGMIARHLDSVKTNCRLSNLEWSTPTQNIADNLDTKVVWTQKLTVEDVVYIRSRTWAQSERDEYCRVKGIETQTHYKALTGRTFKHVPMPEIKNATA